LAHKCQFAIAPTRIKALKDFFAGRDSGTVSIFLFKAGSLTRRPGTRNLRQVSDSGVINWPHLRV
jgi:hypothetical protein